MLEHALHFLHHKDFQSSDLKSVWEKCFASPQDLQSIETHRSLGHQHQKHSTETHMYTDIYTRMYTKNPPSPSLFHSSWAWRSPWRCSTTSTGRGRSTMLSLVGEEAPDEEERRCLMGWDSELNSFHPLLYNLLCPPRPLHRPSVQIPAASLPLSALPSRTIHFAKE